MQDYIFLNVSKMKEKQQCRIKGRRQTSAFFRVIKLQTGISQHNDISRKHIYKKVAESSSSVSPNMLFQIMTYLEVAQSRKLLSTISTAFNINFSWTFSEINFPSSLKQQTVVLLNNAKKKKSPNNLLKSPTVKANCL